jgi:peptidoglycan biosynthesis protein MviN/MurJ (putative lipid II flippase)
MKFILTKPLKKTFINAAAGFAASIAGGVIISLLFNKGTIYRKDWFGILYVASVYSISLIIFALRRYFKSKHD